MIAENTPPDAAATPHAVVCPWGTVTVWHGCDRAAVDAWLHGEGRVGVHGTGFCGVVLTTMMERVTILARHLPFVATAPFLLPLRDGRWFLWFRADDDADPRCAWVVMTADAMPPPCAPCAAQDEARRARMN